MANRLADSLSPYLRQHADNPVDWWEWSPEALAAARAQDRPIFLSVGYAACHWCHVMAHESFEDEQVAAALDEAWVSIKVDREERPDIDAVYMQATQALTGHGGWPMTVLLTPEGDPFFAGTYLPKGDLLRLLDAAGDAWRTRRDELTTSAGTIAARLREMTATSNPSPLGEDDLARAVEQLTAARDPAHGGFGGAPKFPPSMVLQWLLRHHARTGSTSALAMVEETCEAMARGGLHDQLAGGLARYSVDAAWVVPHFEKMLYDNAQLLRVYARWHAATGAPTARRVADGIADVLLRDLGTDQGAFASALDADTPVAGTDLAWMPTEGATYVWTPQQLADVLGADDGARAAELLGVSEPGTFERGTSTLQMLADPDEQWWDDVRQRLLAARAARPQPARDDKVVTSWNGLAIAALAEAAALLQRPELLAAATRCAEHVLATHLVDGRLRRTSIAGRTSSADGQLDDHGDLAEGLLALHQADGDVRWLEAAVDLLEQALDRFRDEAGTWHDTAHDAETLMTRPRTETDNAEPAGVSAVAGALLTAAALTGRTDLREAALTALAQPGQIARAEPRFAGWTLAVAEAAVAGPLQVAVVTEDNTEDEGGAAPFLDVARRSGSPGLVLAHGRTDALGQPLLADRPTVAGAPTAYVCRGFVCEAPVTTPEALAEALR